MTYLSATANPRTIGVDPNQLNALVARARRALEEGPLPSLQIALACQGELALAISLGDAREQQRYNIFS